MDLLDKEAAVNGQTRFAIVLTTIVIVCALASTPSDPLAAWGPSVQLYEDGSVFFVVTDSANNVYVLMDRNMYDNELFYRKKSAGGDWGSVIQLTSGAYEAQSPWAAGDVLGNLHVVWSDGRNGDFDDREIYYKMRDADGDWGPDTRVTNTRFASMFPEIATDADGNVHMVWLQNVNVGGGRTELKVCYKKKTVGGNWSRDVQLTDTPGNSGHPTIAVDGAGNVHVVWSDEYGGTGLWRGIYYMEKSTNGSWNPAILLGSGDQAFSSNVATDPAGNVHFVWGTTPDGCHVRLYYKQKDAGGDWGADTRLDDPVGYAFGGVRVATDMAGNVHAVWQDSRYSASYSEQIYYKKKSAGAGWGTSTPLTYDSSNRFWCHGLTTDAAGNVHVAYGGIPGLYYRERPVQPPILLVHGICSDESIWGPDGNFDFKAALEDSSFDVFTLPTSFKASYNWDKTIQQYACSLRVFIDQMALDPVEKIPVLAYSMGGLVTRWYMKEQGAASRVDTLITIGTPHHGSELATIVAARRSSHRWYTALDRWLLRSSPLRCQYNSQSTIQMAVDAEFLRLLNYGSKSHTDSPPTCRSHDPEQIPSSVAHWTIAGTAGIAPGAFAFALDQMFECTNDGVVTYQSQRLRALPESRNLLDYNLGCDPVLSHTGSPWGSDPAEYDAPCVAAAVANILKGRAPAQQGFISTLPGQTASGYPSLGTLPAIGGVLLAGETKVDSVFLDAVDEFTCTEFGDPGALALTLVDPTGKVITPSDTVDPAIDYVRDGTGIEGYKIATPSPGLWQLRTQPLSVPDSAYYSIMSSVVSLASLGCFLNQVEPNPDVPVTIRADFTNGGSPILGAEIHADVWKPDSSSTTLELFDDGTHGDSVADDGNYANVFGETQLEGLYTVIITAQADSLDPASLKRQTTALFTAHRSPDLAFTSEDIAFSTDPPVAGEPVEVSADIVNIGQADAESVEVIFYDGIPGTEFGEAFISIPAEQIVTASAAWMPEPPDTHTIHVVIGSSKSGLESSYENNEAFRFVALAGSQISVREGPHSSKTSGRFRLSTCLPNPFASAAMIEYELPEEGYTRIRIFDVAGRLVRTLVEERQLAGQRTVSWNGSNDNGAPVSSGIYFCTLEWKDQIITRKLIVLR